MWGIGDVGAALSLLVLRHPPPCAHKCCVFTKGAKTGTETMFDMLPVQVAEGEADLRQEAERQQSKYNGQVRRRLLRDCGDGPRMRTGYDDGSVAGEVSTADVIIRDVYQF